MIPFERYDFAPAIQLPENYDVLDFSQGAEPSGRSGALFSIGRYNEVRPGLYTDQRYQESKRLIHMGIDIGAPAGTPVYSVMDGKVLFAANNSEPQDYGFTLVLQYCLEGQDFYVLYGHLGEKALVLAPEGRAVARGQQIGVVGAETENGGWPPHLHFQVSLKKPDRADMPGVISEAERQDACKTYPDPRLILGPLY